ncbi:MarR family winged helix-turn-helix transcriptional regulator [soil metagenome]
MSDDPLRRPIGWWLKHVDGLLDRSFETILGAEDLSRRQWQILNGLAEGTPGKELLDSLTVFQDATGVQAALEPLDQRGWVTIGDADDVARDGAVQLSDEGREQHTRILAEIRAMRTAVTDGLSEQDYRAVVSGLARMAENLDRLLA